MRYLFLLLCLALTACATYKPAPKEVYSLSVDYNSSYTFTVQKLTDDYLVVSSSITSQGTDMIMSRSKVDPKIFEGSLDLKVQRWSHTRFPEYAFDKIIISSYYSFFSYRALSWIQDYEGGIFAPNCPVETKYLIIFNVDQKVPLFGCIYN